MQWTAWETGGCLDPWLKWIHVAMLQGADASSGRPQSFHGGSGQRVQRGPCFALEQMPENYRKLVLWKSHVGYFDLKTDKEWCTFAPSAFAVDGMFESEHSLPWPSARTLHLRSFQPSRQRNPRNAAAYHVTFLVAEFFQAVIAWKSMPELLQSLSWHKSPAGKVSPRLT